MRVFVLILLQLKECVLWHCVGTALPLTGPLFFPAQPSIACFVFLSSSCLGAFLALLPSVFSEDHGHRSCNFEARLGMLSQYVYKGVMVLLADSTPQSAFHDEITLSTLSVRTKSLMGST